MKKLIFTTYFLLFIAICHGQTTLTMFGVGYNASFVHPATINKILQRYNENRPGLTEPMGQIKYMDGINWNLHWMYQAFMLDFNFDKRASVLSASGNTGYGIFQRDLKFKASTFSLGMGINFAEESPYIGIGFDLDAGANRIDSRLETPELIKKKDYEEITNQIMMGGSIWAQILLCNENNSGIGLAIRPYYHMDFMGTNFTWFNEAINPNTFQNDTFDQYGKMNHFGLQIMCVIIVQDLY